MADTSTAFTPGAGGLFQSYTNTLFSESRISLASTLVDQFGKPIGGTPLYDELLVSQSYTVLSDSIADGISGIWTSTTANGGTNTVVAGEGTVQTSANAAGSAQLISLTVPYHPGQIAWLRCAGRFGDTGSAGNIRRIGCFTVSGTTPQDGFAFELNGTTLNTVTFKAGVATTTAQTSWTRHSEVPFVLDTDYHLYELRFSANRVYFYIDGVMRHTSTASASALTTTLNFPMAIQSINSSGATNRAVLIRNIGMGRFGTPPIGADSVGRQRVSIIFQSTAPATADTLLTLTKYTQGVAGTPATSIGVAANRTLRITSVVFGVRAGAAAVAFGTLTVRSNPTGATLIGSPSELRIDSGFTSASINSSVGRDIPIYEGMEFKGAETIGASLIAQATTNIITVALIGYEY